MDENTWLTSQLEQLRQSSSDYRDQAFYLALNDFVQEQSKRMEQIQRELDGRMWE
jgi:ferritin